MSGPDERIAAAHAVLRTVHRDLLDRHALTGVGVGLKVTRGVVTGEPCIKAFVPRKLPPERLSPGIAVPQSIPGTKIGTDVEEMAMPTVPPWRSYGEGWQSYYLGNPWRHRPILGGDSVSHRFGTLGTVAGLVADSGGGGRALLSCNHVLAGLNRGVPGDLVVQPAVGDGGRVPLDICGVLARFVPVRFDSIYANRVDAAIADVADDVAVAAVDWVGIPAGVRAGGTLALGEEVFKVGRTTGLTRGVVVALHVSGWLSYPPILGGSGVALFEEQIVTTGMAGFGDSGSLVMDGAHRAVGLLFGGSATHTLINDIAEVQQQLDVRLLTKA